MSRSLLFVATLALPGLIGGAAFAQSTTTAAEVATEAEAAAATAEADATEAQAAAAAAASTATDTQTAADAQAATEAQAAADAAMDTANTADTTAGDATAEASFSNFRLQSMRAVKIATNSHRLTGTVSGDDDGELTTVEVLFEGPLNGGPASLANAYTLVRTETGYDATGKLQFSADGAGQPVWDQPYDLTLSLVDANGPSPTPIVLSGVPVGTSFNVTGPPVIFGGTAYALQSVDWSESEVCYGCPIISLLDVGDPTQVPPVIKAPVQVIMTGEPVSTVLVGSFEATFESFAITATFEDESLDFDTDALGFEYLVTGTMFSGDVPVGEPTPFKLLIEEDDTTPPAPVPTLVIDTNLSGSVTVNDGDYVLLQAMVGKDITVNEGGTLLIQGGVVGRDLKLDGGQVILADATIVRSLKADGGSIEVGEAVIGRDLEIDGGVEMVGDSLSFLVVGRDVKGSTSDSVVLGGNIDVLERVHLRAGNLTVNDSLSAEGDIELSTRGNVDGGLVVNGDISAETGEIEMRTQGGGGLDVNGSLQADGEVNLRADKGGDLTVAGTVTVADGEIDARVEDGGNLTINGVVDAAGDLDFRVRDGDGDLTIGGDISSSTGTVELRVNNGGGSLIVNGIVTAAGNVDVRVREGGVVIGVGGVLDALANVDLDSVSTTVVNGDVSAVGDITIDSGTTSEVNGTVTSQGLIDLDSGTNTTVTGSVTSQDSIAVGSGGTTLIQGFGGSPILMTVLTAGASGDIVLTSGGSTTINGNVSASGNFLGAGVSIYANTDDTGGSNDSDGWMIAGGNIDFDATNTLVVSGDLTAQGDITLDSGSSTEVNGTVTATGYVGILGTPTIVAGSDDLLWGGGGFKISGGDGVSINTTETVSMERGIVESPGGSVTIQARGIVGRWSFDDSAGQDSSMLIQASNNVTIQADETVDLVGVTVQADLGSVSLIGDACDASWGVDDVQITVLMVISGGSGVNIDMTQTVDLAGTQVVSSGGDIDIVASSFRQKQNLPLDVPDTELDAYGSIIITGTNYLELFGTYTWDNGASFAEVDPTLVFASGGTASLLPGLGGAYTDPGALLAMVQGG